MMNSSGMVDCFSSFLQRCCFRERPKLNGEVALETFCGTVRPSLTLAELDGECKDRGGAPGFLLAPPSPSMTLLLSQHSVLTQAFSQPQEFKTLSLVFVKTLLPFLTFAQAQVA